MAAVRTDGGPARSYSILAPGFAKWWGSDARALAQAFRRLGHSVIDIDAEDYVSWRCQGLAPKVMRRLFGRVWIDDYNQAVLKQASSSSYDFILVFKGNLLKSETVAQLKGTARPLYNVYPDVSFEDHGPDIPAALRLYDCVFTTKSYHGEAEIQRFGIQNLQHVRHGFDPDVHRPVPLSGELVKHYASDVSFVGCWSAEKEEKIANLLKRCAALTIKVYGMGWHYASSEFKRRMGPNLKAGVFGDELSIVYCASRVNLGLLSCSKSDATLCDQTTARTFQIPATGSLMLHEDTPEVRTFFEEGREVELFNNNEELIEKVEIALSSPGIAKDIRKRGYERCRREPYDYSSTAQNIINYYEAN